MACICLVVGFMFQWNWEVFECLDKYDDQLCFGDLYGMLCAMWYHLYNLKDVKNTPEGAASDQRFNFRGCAINRTREYKWNWFFLFLF